MKKYTHYYKHQDHGKYTQTHHSSCSYLHPTVPSLSSPLDQLSMYLIGSLMMAMGGRSVIKPQSIGDKCSVEERWGGRRVKRKGGILCYNRPFCLPAYLPILSPEGWWSMWLLWLSRNGSGKGAFFLLFNCLLLPLVGSLPR